MKLWPFTCGMVFLAAVLGACTTPGALRTTAQETALQPQEVSRAGIDNGRQVAWGGTVVTVRNLEERTRLEVLAFPLDRDGMPDTAARPTGRFLADYPGYLDPVDYAPGRRVTLRGILTGIRSGKVGDAAYEYPVIEVMEVRPWPPSPAAGTWLPPQLHIGIGVYGGF